MNIVIIGSGNVATHLAKAFFAQGHDIKQVYSKTSANAHALADAVNAHAISSFRDIRLDADLYLLAVSDNAMEEVVKSIPKNIQGLIVHTSGATNINILSSFQRIGVIYPPQSINKTVETDLSLIPFGLEGNSQEVLDCLFELMKNIAPKIFACNSQQRLALHLSAVLVNNFPNALYQMASEILEKENLDFDLLKPIILETAKKVQIHNPKDVQTGPAKRNDTLTINKHLEFLSYSEEQRKIYQYLSNFIINRYHK